jgi:hypothetical protein
LFTIPQFIKPLLDSVVTLRSVVFSNKKGAKIVASKENVELLERLIIILLSEAELSGSVPPEKI